MIIQNSGNVGIGATSPGEKLEINGNIRIYNSSNAPYIDFVESGAITDSKARITMDQIDGSNGTLLFATEGSGTLTERMRITSAGEVKIGTTTVNSNGLTIEKTGNHMFLRASTAVAGRYMNFDITSANDLYIINHSGTGVYLDSGATSWASSSDESLKENIKPLENVLDKIKNYRCVEYNLKSDDTKGKKIGFIAQDWENDFAPIVNKDKNNSLGMKYTETIPVLLKAIQELKAEIEILKNK